MIQNKINERKVDELQIIKNQTILANNLISYVTKVKKSDIIKLIRHISQNLQALNLKIGKKIIFNIKSEFDNGSDQIIEVLIPVKGKVPESNEFQYKPVFRLINAITIRHEGSLNDIEKTEKCLKDFIKENNYEPITDSYFIVVREGSENAMDCIIDIYIGVNYNSL